MKLAETEPVTLAGAPAVLFNAVAGVLLAFGVWEPTEQQIAAVLTLINVVVLYASVLWARARVTPVGGS